MKKKKLELVERKADDQKAILKINWKICTIRAMAIVEGEYGK